HRVCDRLGSPASALSPGEWCIFPWGTKYGSLTRGRPFSSVFKEAATSCADIPYDMLFAAVYTLVDDWYQAVGWQMVRSRPGVKPTFTDSAVLTVEIVRDLEGERRERRWYAKVAANWRHLFPRLPERSVLHKRTKSLWLLRDRCRCAVRNR